MPLNFDWHVFKSLLKTNAATLPRHQTGLNAAEKVIFSKNLANSDLYSNRQFNGP